MQQKPQIRIADTQFAHGTSLGSGDLKIYPQYFDWYRGSNNINDVIVITESMFHKVDQFTEKIKIAWLLEPMSINPDSYKWIRANWWKFDYILTHRINDVGAFDESKDVIMESYPDIIKTGEETWYPFGGCWIMPEDRKIYPKTKAISIIASDKRETEGHCLRHEVIAALGNKVDVFGRGYNPIPSKLEALKDYQYSIVIENESTDGFFTEKIIDCFMTGTFPIYWGDPNLGDRFFNQLAGIGPFVNFKYFQTIGYLYDLVDQINGFTKNGRSGNDKIPDMTDSVLKYNFKKAKEFACPEDWLWLNFFKKHDLIK